MILKRREAQDFPPESWAFVVRKLADDAYLIYRGGEVSLVTKDSLTCLLKQLLKGQTS